MVGKSHQVTSASTIDIVLNTFNRGVTSEFLNGRSEIERAARSASEMINWYPRTFGSMSLRAGTEYRSATYLNRYAITYPFKNADNVQVEFTDGAIRFLVDDQEVTRDSVTTAITNGNFTSNITGWTDASDVGANTSWLSGGYLSLAGDGAGAYAKSYQLVTVPADSIGKDHGIRFVIDRGNITLRIGSTLGGNEYIKTTIGKGTHSIDITPVGNFYIQFESYTQQVALVNSCQIESGGVLLLSTPYGVSDLSNIQQVQSFDVMYLTCAGYAPMQIERRSNTSWSFVNYLTEDGPFNYLNTTSTTISASALAGNVGLTASRDIFSADHIGTLVKLVSAGQFVQKDFVSDNVFSDSVRVVGVGDARKFVIVLSGTFVATITLQRQFEGAGGWEDVQNYSTSTTITYDDHLDNQIVYYRFGIKTGNYTSGTVSSQIKYSYGSKTGIVRITNYSSPTVVSAEVLKTLGNNTATTDWAFGYWSGSEGQPTAIEIMENRLCFATREYVFCSVSDVYSSFDQTMEGNAAPIIKSIADSDAGDVNWLSAGEQLLIGAKNVEMCLRSNSLGELLTPSNASIKKQSSWGNTACTPIKIDKSILFVNDYKMIESLYDTTNAQTGNTEANKIAPEICQPSIIKMAVQRRPETIIHCVRSDGKVVILVYDMQENVKGFALWDIVDGFVEDCYLVKDSSQTIEDRVYYTIRRTVNGQTVRYHERVGLHSQTATGTALPQIMDCFAIRTTTGSITSVKTIPDLGHLEGKTVDVWRGGVLLGSYTVSGGVIALDNQPNAQVIVGLELTAQYMSKDISDSQKGLNSVSRITKIVEYGLKVKDTDLSGVTIGTDYDNMYGIDKEYPSQPDVQSLFDTGLHSIQSVYDTENRICIKAKGKPCTILAIRLKVEVERD